VTSLGHIAAVGTHELVAISEDAVVFVRTDTGAIGTWKPPSGRRPDGSVVPVDLQSVTAGAQGRFAWVYDFGRQLFLRLDPTRPESPVRGGVRIPYPSFRGIWWLGDWALANVSAPPSVRYFRPTDSSSAARSGPPATVGDVFIDWPLATPTRAVPTGPFPNAVPGVLVHLNAASLITSDKMKRFAVAYRAMSRIDVFTEAGILERQIAGPHAIPIVYGAKARSASAVDAGQAPIMLFTTDETRFAYLDLETYGEYLLALFDGKAGGMQGSPGAREIQVFNWDGRLIDTWALDVPIISFCIGGTPVSVYGIRADRRGIAQFNISSLLSAVSE
jgi:hypothetical protein